MYFKCLLSYIKGVSGSNSLLCRNFEKKIAFIIKSCSDFDNISQTIYAAQSNETLLKYFLMPIFKDPIVAVFLKFYFWFPWQPVCLKVTPTPKFNGVRSARKTDWNLENS